MNKVFLSGVIATQPVMAHRPEQVAHAAFQLRVDHRKTSGEIVRETYPVNAWGKTAEWAVNRLRVGTVIALNGILTQRAEQDRTMVEITTSEIVIPAGNGGEQNGRDIVIHT